jgi:glycosyltransferase involved in cell wall biosynthesis
MEPFVWGGAEELAANLIKNLELAGHEAELLRIPFAHQDPRGLAGQISLVRSLEVQNTDKVIALKFPAYLIRHPNKTIWLLHQFRQAYDLFEAGQSNIPRNGFGDTVRKMIRGADNLGFHESIKVFTNSEVTKQRLIHFNGINSEVLHPPVNDAHLFAAKPSKGYIFAGGRINKHKRQEMFIEALALTDQPVKLVVGGPPDSAGDAQALVELASSLGVKDRVKFDFGFLAREKYAEYINNSLAVAYAPFDEDSFGYVAMEAASASKAVLTSTDAGGVTHLIRDCLEGLVTKPNPREVARALDRLFVQHEETLEMGLRARTRLNNLDLNWPAVIRRLIS